MLAITDKDGWGNRWMAKVRSLNKIDPSVALCLTFGAAAVALGMAAGSAPRGLDVLAMIA